MIINIIIGFYVKFESNLLISKIGNYYDPSKYMTNII